MNTHENTEQMEMQKALVVIVWQPAPGATEKKILLLRLIPRRGAFWQPVTGRVEPGESFAEGALREAQEESGLHFERQPQYLGLEHTFPGRANWTVHERSFFLPLFGGSSPPTPTLDGKEHDAFAWLDPLEAAARVKYPGNRQAIERAASGASPLLLSSRGSFFQDGEEITHARTADLFHRSLVRQSDGHFTVRIGNEELEVIVEDNPRFVKAYDRASGEFTLSDGSKEILNPETLLSRADNSLACTLANGWNATFLSQAFYEISQDLNEGSVQGEYVLHFLGRNHPLRIANEGEGKNR